MELLVETELLKAGRLKALMQEANEILAIVVSAAKTARTNRTFRIEASSAQFNSMRVARNQPLRKSSIVNRQFA
jgi:hypothetical protein